MSTRRERESTLKARNFTKSVKAGGFTRRRSSSMDPAIATPVEERPAGK